MISRYTVVHYLPHPLSGERINVGVIAWGSGLLAARFINNWRRVRAFGHEDVEFLQDFIRNVERSVSNLRELPGLDAPVIDENRLKQIIGNWTHSIQFSEPRSSIDKTPELLIEEIAPIYLTEPLQATSRAQRRRAAAAIAAQKVFEVVEAQRGAFANELVKKSYPLQGKLDEHTFDVVVTNGRPYLAVQGLSFEVASSPGMRREIDATAWAIDDVKRENKKFPLAVLMLPPDDAGGGDSDIFLRAKKVFKGLHADVVESDRQIGSWVKRRVRALPQPSSRSLVAGD